MVVLATWVVCAAASALRASSRTAFCSSIESDQKSINGMEGQPVDNRDLLYFLRNSHILVSFAFASVRSCAFVMLVAGVCFQR